MLTLLSESNGKTYFFNYSKKAEQLGNLSFVPFNAFTFLRALWQCIGRDVLVISQEGRYDRLGVWLKRIFGFKLLLRRGGVFYGRGYIQGKIFEGRKKKLRLARHADAIISTADGTPAREYFAALDVPGDKVVTFLNGFPVIENKGGYARDHYITCISRLQKIKSVDYVVKSFAAAKDRLDEQYTLRLVGDGPERANLMRLASDLKIEDRVEFVGTSRDIERWYYSSRLILSALSNNPVIESIATASPVICVDLGEMMDLYGKYPNVTVVPYPYGGCGKIPEAEESPLVQRTADEIVRILNGKLWTTPVEIDYEERGWPKRLRKEMDIYERLLTSNSKIKVERRVRNSSDC